ncbi:carbohydrate ABC transporter permease, partial [Chloroflexota bacterium]
MMQALGPRIETLFWAAGTVLFILVGSYLVAVVARWLAGRAKLSRSEQQRVFWGFLFASPWIIGFVIFVVGPSLASLYYSFTEYKLGTTPEWIGLENFRELIQTSGRDGRNFRSSMYNSMYYAVVGVPLQVTASLLMAMLLNQALKGISAFRLVYYLPVILAGGPAILLAWRYMLSDNGGFVNESIHALGAAIPPLGVLARASFFAVEGFNGFFIGLTKGDP